MDSVLWKVLFYSHVKWLAICRERIQAAQSQSCSNMVDQWLGNKVLTAVKYFTRFDTTMSKATALKQAKLKTTCVPTTIPNSLTKSVNVVVVDVFLILDDHSSFLVRLLRTSFSFNSYSCGLCVLSFFLSFLVKYLPTAKYLFDGDSMLLNISHFTKRKMWFFYFLSRSIKERPSPT